MAGYSEKPQTPDRLASLAAEYKDFSDFLSRAVEAMRAHGIDSMPMPRKNAEEVGLKETRRFVYTVRDVVTSIGREIMGGVPKDDAIEKVLSEYRNTKRKTAKKTPKKTGRKSEADKSTIDLTPISKAS